MAGCGDHGTEHPGYVKGSECTDRIRFSGSVLHGGSSIVRCASVIMYSLLHDTISYFKEVPKKTT